MASRRRDRARVRRPSEYERQASHAVQADPDVQPFVERLEAAADAEAPSAEAQDVPSGDVLAREFQRFLSQRPPRDE